MKNKKSNYSLIPLCLISSFSLAYCLGMTKEKTKISDYQYIFFSYSLLRGFLRTDIKNKYNGYTSTSSSLEQKTSFRHYLNSESYVEANH